ncbi:hypothetical protein [Kitasatospora azatica]|uniref:hypothetical protein n=1 Tax=Kitasatospora azatica TaxID=58347 RepID=UPI000A73CCBA|nr:hypothetical protein [Kitasatospora azatica]
MRWNALSTAKTIQQTAGLGQPLVGAGRVVAAGGLFELGEGLAGANGRQDPSPNAR